MDYKIGHSVDKIEDKLYKVVPKIIRKEYKNLPENIQSLIDLDDVIGSLFGSLRIKDNDNEIAENIFPNFENGEYFKTIETFDYLDFIVNKFFNINKQSGYNKLNAPFIKALTCIFEEIYKDRYIYINNFIDYFSPNPNRKQNLYKLMKNDIDSFIYIKDKTWNTMSFEAYNDKVLNAKSIVGLMKNAKNTFEDFGYRASVLIRSKQKGFVYIGYQQQDVSLEETILIENNLKNEIEYFLSKTLKNKKVAFGIKDEVINMLENDMLIPLKEMDKNNITNQEFNFEDEFLSYHQIFNKYRIKPITFYLDKEIFEETNSTNSIKINKNSLVLKSKDKFIEDIKDVLKVEMNFPSDGLFKNLKVKEEQKDLVVQFNLNDKLEEERKLKVIEEFKTLLLDVFLELMENQQWTKYDNLWRLNFRLKEKIKVIYVDKFSDFNRESGLWNKLDKIDKPVEKNRVRNKI